MYFLVNNPKDTVLLLFMDASNISKVVEKVFKMLDETVEKVGKENLNHY